jgi:hypothetical protein
VHGDGVIVAGDLADPLEQRVDLVLRALDLDDEERLDVERITGGDEAACSVVSKPSSIGRAPSGAFNSRTVASVTTPNWPSEPMISARKS